MDFRYCPWCASPFTISTVDLRERSVCSSACGFVYWNNPIPVVAALIVHGDQVILVRQPNWPVGWYGLVTGFLEKSEEPSDAVAREVREELGLTPSSVKWLGEYAYPEQNQLILAYVVECRGEITLSDELSGFKLVAIHDLKPWPFGTGKAVADWLNRCAGAPDASDPVKRTDKALSGE